jgi:succinate dehydrogenase/fumarate reductase flavoprotein subunit
MNTSKWDREADVIVVGSGAAAYSAAITSRAHKANVIMIEKASIYGGTTLRSGGGFWIPNNRFQREKGITDKKEDAVNYMAGIHSLNYSTRCPRWDCRKMSIIS